MSSSPSGITIALVMDRSEQGVRGCAQVAAGVEGAAVRSEPAVPESTQPEQTMVPPADPLGLVAGRCLLRGLGRKRPPFVEAIDWDEAATMSPCPPEEGFAGHGFIAGIDRPGVAGGVLEPGRNESPTI